MHGGVEVEACQKDCQPERTLLTGGKRCARSYIVSTERLAHVGFYKQLRVNTENLQHNVKQFPD